METTNPPILTTGTRTHPAILPPSEPGTPQLRPSFSPAPCTGQATRCTHSTMLSQPSANLYPHSEDCPAFRVEEAGLSDQAWPSDSTHSLLIHTWQTCAAFWAASMMAGFLVIGGNLPLSWENQFSVCHQHRSKQSGQVTVLWVR